MELTRRVLNVQKPAELNGVIIEAWAQGFMVGALIIMACITFANMKKSVLLHKLILLELILGMFHGTFIFTNPPVYHWYLSVTAIFLNISWTLHNVIAWIKSKPLLPRWASICYITTVALVQPYWVLELVANFLYFGDKSALFTYTRPWEALFRDPWWIISVVNLLWMIKTRYNLGFFELARVSPRFAVLLGAMMLSMCFVLTDILAVTHVISTKSLPDGINPFWKLGFVFKCLTDTIILDDFKTALDRLTQYNLQRMGSVLSDGVPGEYSDVEQARRKKAERKTTPMQGPQSNVTTRDWIKGSNSEHIDLESALHVDSTQGGESSGTNG